MKNYLKIILFSFLLIPIRLFGQGGQAASYQRAASLYREAASKTKCPETRGKVLLEYASWNQCMADVLAGKRSSCGPSPTTPVPPCDGDMIGGKTNISDPSRKPADRPTTDNEASADDIPNLINGLAELGSIKLDNNKETNSWFLISGGVNLDGDKGPLFGTTADMGKAGGYFLSFQGLERKGLSFSSTCVFLKSSYFHSFRAKGNDGEYRQYIGKTTIEMTSVDINLGKDLTGESGSFHFVPGIGANLIFNIDNNFTSSNYTGVEYSEEWDKNLFFGLNGSVQMFYLFSKRIGLQGGMKYFYFPKEYGTAIKTGNFFNLNIGLAFRML